MCSVSPVDELHALGQTLVKINMFIQKNKALQYTQSNLLIGENDNNIIRIDGNATNQRQNNEPNSNKPILTFSVPYNTNTTHIGSILRKHWHLIVKTQHSSFYGQNTLWFPTNATIILRTA